MSMRTAVRRALVVLGATGSLVPWLAPTAVEPHRSPPPTPPPAVAGSTAAGVPSTTHPRLRGTWSWPLHPRPSVKAPFVAPRTAYGAGHRGIDVVASAGQQVLAVDAGVVAHVGMVAGRGTVTVTHGSGLRSTYEPVRPVVATGSTMAEGQVLGHVEGRSHCGGACLHLGALRGTAYVDPRPLLNGGPVILLPLEPAG